MRSVLFVIICLFLSSSVIAQGEISKKRTLSDKVFFGGGIGLQFGSYTGIEVAPVVGYKPVNNLYTGIRFSYQYIGGSSVSFSQNVWGGSLFAQYVLFDRLIAHAEYESLYVKTDWDYFPSEKFWANTPLIGGGLYQKIGERSAMVLLALFDVRGDVNSIYSNPIIRISFIF